MTDAEAAKQAVEGLVLVLGAFGAIPAGIAGGLAALATAAGYFFGDKHEAKRSRKSNQINQVQEENEDA